MFEQEPVPYLAGGLLLFIQKGPVSSRSSIFSLYSEYPSRIALEKGYIDCTVDPAAFAIADGAYRELQGYKND